MKRAIVCLVIFVAASSLLAFPVLAGPPTDYVKGILDSVLAIQNNPALAGDAQEPARAKAIRQIIQKNFDFPTMARNSLGATYGRLGAGQRQEFTEIFSYLFQDSYTRLVLNFLKKETIRYDRERLEDGKARVHTTLVRANETIPVEYLMRSAPNFLLYDVIVDGVSILDNYQRQFSQVIRTSSFETLMGKLRAQYRAVK